MFENVLFLSKSFVKKKKWKIINGSKLKAFEQNSGNTRHSFDYFNALYNQWMCGRRTTNSSVYKKQMFSSCERMTRKRLKIKSKSTKIVFCFPLILTLIMSF